MKQRFVSGLLLAAAATGIIFWGLTPVIVAVIVIAVLALYELFSLLFRDGEPGSPVIPKERKRPRNLLFQFLIFFVGFIFIVLSLSFAVWLRYIDLPLLFLCIGAAAVCDTVAYTIGKQFGKRKLAPRLSPGKTIEGSVAGVLGAIALTLLIGNKVGMSWSERIIAGFFLGWAAILGDLLESALKRYAGVKDSGNLLPGHGGILDRIDSHLGTLFAAGSYVLFLIARFPVPT